MNGTSQIGMGQANIVNKKDRLYKFKEPYKHIKWEYYRQEEQDSKEKGY